jgi:hypothetical protein
MKKGTSTVLTAAAFLAALFLVLEDRQGEAKMGISGREMVRTLDVRIHPEQAGKVEYVLHLANGLVKEGSLDGWEAMDQLLRLTDLLGRGNISVWAELDNDRLDGFLIRSGVQF